MNLSLLDADVQKYIQENLNTDLTKILFKKSQFKNVSSRDLAEQISSKKAAEKKLPLWFKSHGIYFPPKLAIEQSSSEITAEYKSRLLKGNTILDLSGGMGVDTHYFAKKAAQVIHVEMQPQLSAIATHNSEVLQQRNIHFVNDTAENFLDQHSDSWDAVYLDPSRRIKSQKVFKLTDCEPNIVALRDSLLTRSKSILVKTSPLLDIRSGLNELKKVKELHILSVNNEMKELLWLLDYQCADKEPLIKCVSLNNGEERYFDFRLSEEKTSKIESYSKVLRYLYEPDAAWLKAGCFKLMAARYEVGKLHQHTHLYTSEILKKEFPGKKFSIQKCWTFKEFSQEKPLNKANVVCRNFPLTVEQVRKKIGLKEGGNDYLFCCTACDGELLILQAERL